MFWRLILWGRCQLVLLKVGGGLLRALLGRLAKLIGCETTVWSLAGAALHLSPTDVSLQASPSDTSPRRLRLSLKGIPYPILSFWNDARSSVQQESISASVFPTSQTLLRWSGEFWTHLVGPWLPETANLPRSPRSSCASSIHPHLPSKHLSFSWAPEWPSTQALSFGPHHSATG